MLSAALPTSVSPHPAKPAADPLEPPGGLLVWLIVFVEIVTFGAGIGVFLFQGRDHAVAFAAGRAMLDQPMALANTLVLVTGGWSMACCLHELRLGRIHAARRWIHGAVASGLLFLVLKAVEYLGKIRHGIGFGEDVFFTLYYALTGFHFIHVLVAVVLLSFMARGLRRGRYGRDDHQDVESCGIFWHMCDLIWLLLYPILYLL